MACKILSLKSTHQPTEHHHIPQKYQPQNGYNWGNIDSPQVRHAPTNWSQYRTGEPAYRRSYQVYKMAPCIDDIERCQPTQNYIEDEYPHVEFDTVGSEEKQFRHGVVQTLLN